MDQEVAVRKAGPRSASGLCHRSEQQLQPELDPPREGPLAGHHAESGAGWAGVRSAEHRVVPGVQELPSELQVHVLAQTRSLDHRQVPDIHAVGAHVAQPGRKGTVVRAELLRGVAIETGIDIEPAIRRTLADGHRDVVNIADEQHVAPGERRPPCPV